MSLAFRVSLVQGKYINFHVKGGVVRKLKMACNDTSLLLFSASRRCCGSGRPVFSLFHLCVHLW